MEGLRTAVVDIATLVATCRAVKARRQQGKLARSEAVRACIRRELRRATSAYIDTLARSKLGMVDDALLRACRVAAERKMPAALGCQAALGRLMARQPGALEGTAAARHDLWRLAHMTVYLGIGVAAVRTDKAITDSDLRDAAKLSSRLRRRLRRALIAYARTSHRVKAGHQGVLAAARAAAQVELGARAVRDADRLVNIEVRDPAKPSIIRRGVARPLQDLALDWQPGDGKPR